MADASINTNPIILSVIIPTLNENAYIISLIQSIYVNDQTTKEIILADGGSTDGTLEQISILQQTHKNLLLIHNDERYVSQGFNKAFTIAKGKFIALVGAHALYPPNYFSNCIYAIESGACEVSGGVWLQKGKTSMGNAQCGIIAITFL